MNDQNKSSALADEQEEWRDVPGVPGYRVSNMGRVIGTKGKILKPSNTATGYHRVTVTGAIPKNRSVHGLVLSAFIGPRPEGQEARHLNGKRKDNRLSNLAWGTPKENGADRVVHGTLPVGVRHGFAKLTEDQVRIIREVYASRTSFHWGSAELGRRFNVDGSTVLYAARGITWKCVSDDRKGNYESQ